MILPILVDYIGQQLSNVIKHTMPDVNNQNICMQIKYNQKLFTIRYTSTITATLRTTQVEQTTQNHHHTQ